MGISLRLFDCLEKWCCPFGDIHIVAKTVFMVKTASLQKKGIKVSLNLLFVVVNMRTPSNGFLASSGEGEEF